MSAASSAEHDVDCMLTFKWLYSLTSDCVHRWAVCLGVLHADAEGFSTDFVLSLFPTLLFWNWIYLMLVTHVLVGNTLCLISLLKEVLWESKCVKSSWSVTSKEFCKSGWYVSVELFCEGSWLLYGAQFTVRRSLTLTPLMLWAWGGCGKKRRTMGLHLNT